MYRAYWAIPRTMRTRAGEQTNTAFGMASMLLAILKAEEPDAMLLCFDAGEETFRHEEHDTYKDGRAETPDDFYAQIPRVIELVDAFGFSHVSDTQYEADDFLCTYARAGEAAGMKVTIVTGDKDALQLATDKITVAIPHKGYQQTEYLNPEGIVEKMGIRPDQVASFKGLSGDSSDNLPGVLGIGPKTASKLLQQYNDLDGIYAHLDELRDSVREKLERDKEQAYFCERMAELVCVEPLPVSLEDITLTNMPVQPVLELFTELEFTMLVKRFQAVLDSSYGQQHFRVEEAALPVQATDTTDQLALF